MRRFFAVAAGSAAALVGFAGAAQPSATIDLIWEDTGTNEIDNSGPILLQLNVILTAGPTGSEGAGVSVDFSDIGEIALVVQLVGAESDTPKNTPTIGKDTALPVQLEFPLIRGSRVELINSVCVCDLDIGTGLEAGQSHQLGYVTFNANRIPRGSYEIRSDADGSNDGVLDGDGNEILPKTDITFNSAFIDIKRRNPRWKHKRYP